MANKTAGVKLLVEDVLRTFSEPYPEDIIRDVFYKIEKNQDWRRRYKEFGEELEKEWIVNNWIGKYVKTLSGMRTLRQVPVEDGHVFTSYTKLGY